MELEEIAKKYGFKLQKDTKDDYSFKPVFTIWGDKGVGKTSFAFTFPGTIVAISYDGKTRIIKKKFVDMDPKNEERITVEDLSVPQAIVNNPVSSMYILDLGEEIVEHTRFILSNYKPDWFLFDGMDYLVQHCEMYMRKGETKEDGTPLGPFDGISNRNLWKKRNAYLRQLFRLGQKNANIGIMNTAYQTFVDVNEDDGTSKKIKTPKWSDIVMYETDFAFNIGTSFESRSGTTKFYTRVSTTKYDKIFQYGRVDDVTGYPTIINPLAFSTGLENKKVENTPQKQLEQTSPKVAQEVHSEESEGKEDFWDV